MGGFAGKQTNKYGRQKKIFMYKFKFAFHKIFLDKYKRHPGISLRKYWEAGKKLHFHNKNYKSRANAGLKRLITFENECRLQFVFLQQRPFLPT